ncbi:MAG: helix-turn-helix domain-containing protein [Pelistega sp.]|nr:helix-turn-helix domain-containing protein [Pelistega sp.]
MDKELKQFEDELLQSVREMKAKNFAASHKIYASEAAKIRNDSGLSQAAFAKLMGVSIRTLQEWEQGRRNPSGAAKTLFKVAKQHPEILRELL